MIDRICRLILSLNTLKCSLKKSTEYIFLIKKKKLKLIEMDYSVHLSFIHFKLSFHSIQKINNKLINKLKRVLLSVKMQINLYSNS